VGVRNKTPRVLATCIANALIYRNPETCADSFLPLEDEFWGVGVRNKTPRVLATYIANALIYRNPDICADSFLVPLTCGVTALSTGRPAN
jgi:hypothetical protein